MNYSQKLKDPRWQKRRLQIFERDNWTCKSCGSKTESLHVHHLFYFSNKEPWDIPPGFLITLCERCHLEKTYDEEKTCSEYIINDVSVLLDTFWSKGFGTNDLLLLASTIFDAKVKNQPLVNIRLDLIYKT